MKKIIFTFLILVSVNAFSQKKVLDHKDFEVWKAIKSPEISSNGEYIIYSLEKGEKDSFFKIKDVNANLIFSYERSEKGKFSYDGNYAFFTIKAWKDSVKELKREQGKKAKLPKDTLGIYNLNTKKLIKIGNVKSYKTPEKWEGYIAYLMEEVKADIKKKKNTTKTDTVKNKSKKKNKEVGKKNGYHLVLRDLITNNQDTLRYVTDYIFAKEGKKVAYITTGLDSTISPGIYVIDLKSKVSTHIYETKKAKYFGLNFSDSGNKLGFIVDVDSTKVQIRPNELYTWKEGDDKAFKQLDENSAPVGYRVSSDRKINFSKDESKLYFGLSTDPIEKDTTLLEEEIVNVEVWTYNEPRLYTVQKFQVENDRRKSYETVFHFNENKIIQIATEDYPNSKIGNEGNSDYAIVSTTLPYELESQWKGYKASNYAIVNLKTGETKEVLKNIASSGNLSPKGKYLYGYNSVDSTWFTFSIKSKKMVNLSSDQVFYDELNDSPRHPSSYGLAGWTENDEAILIYDRYDIYKFDPNTRTSSKLTNGRESKTVYRYLRIDKEERFLSSGKWLLSTFNEETKDAGYFEFNPKNNKGKQLTSGSYRFSKAMKARKNNSIIFTRESFTEFPNIRYSDLNFKKEIIISNANPQQNDYNWGTAELMNWTSLDGIDLTGVLVKPENFDPSKKYPMLVNFYEKSSNDLHRYRTPAPGRSTINYSFYTSRGYVIFNPDVHYRIGYPGESAYNCVIPGVTSLIEKGFVDKDNIGVQGHSWGAYQIAYLVTKTDIFKVAESGAPVINMINAYGGIRWGSGLSRQFQYEHTQSRIGGTPWEYPARYIENSPIFNIDKINTPLLIMHNDADGHVPWYQGIEFFTTLRRLQKPSWFLNYNGEPHWPLKMQNRKDFNIRMQQFFDYYLKDAPKPVWMERGVPAIEKGINQGYELLEK